MIAQLFMDIFILQFFSIALIFHYNHEWQSTSRYIDSKKEEIQESLSKIAVININKDSSDTGGRSLNHNIEQAREYYENFLDRQIEHLNPHVVIYGNTFQFLSVDSGTC